MTPPGAGCCALATAAAAILPPLLPAWQGGDWAAPLPTDLLDRGVINEGDPAAAQRLARKLLAGEKVTVGERVAAVAVADVGMELPGWGCCDGSAVDIIIHYMGALAAAPLKYLSPAPPTTTQSRWVAA